jgi:hypothetical protein
MLVLQIILLGLAAFVAPVAVMIAIALQGTTHPQVNGSAFVLGGIGGYACIVISGVAAASAVSLSQNGQPSTLSLVIKTVLGLVLIAAAVVAFVKKFEVRIPEKVEGTLQSFGPVKSLVLGIWMLPGYKNIALVLAAINDLAARANSVGFNVAAMAVFFLVALLPPVSPLIVHWTQPPDKAADMLVGWRTLLDKWVLRIVVGVASVVGLILLIESVSGLVKG